MIGECYAVSRSSTPDSEPDSICGEIFKMKSCESGDWMSDWQSAASRGQHCGRLWDTEINLFDDLNTSVDTRQHVGVDNRSWSVDISDQAHSKTQHDTQVKRCRPVSLPQLILHNNNTSHTEWTTTTLNNNNSDASSSSQLHPQSTTATTTCSRVEVSASIMYEQQRQQQQQQELRLRCCAASDDNMLTTTPDDLLTTPAGFYDRQPALLSNASTCSLSIRPLFDNNCAPTPHEELTPSSSSDNSEVCSTCDDLCDEVESLYSASAQCDVDTLDCVRSVLQTVLPEEICLSNEACLKLLSRLQQSTAHCATTPRPSHPADTKSHLNPDAPSFDYYSHHPTAIYPVAMRPIAMPMTFAPATLMTLPGSRTTPPRHRRQQMLQNTAAAAAALVWRPTPMTITYTPFYDGSGMWTQYPRPTAVPLYSYYPTQPVYYIGQQQLINTSRLNKRRSPGKHSSSNSSRAAA